MTKNRLARSLLPFTLVALVVAALPSHASAQVRRGRAAPAEPGWAPIAIGGLLGFDQRAQGEVVAARMRVPILPSGRVELVPGAAAIFPIGERESQYDIDVAFAPGGTRGGLVVGGGVAWRNTTFGTSPGDPRNRFFGYNLFVGGKTGAGGRIQIEALLRWTFLNDTQYQPNLVGLGALIPLWGVGPSPTR